MVEAQKIYEPEPDHEIDQADVDPLCPLAVEMSSRLRRRRRTRGRRDSVICFRPQSEINDVVPTNAQRSHWLKFFVRSENNQYARSSPKPTKNASSPPIDTLLSPPLRLERPTDMFHPHTVSGQMSGIQFLMGRTRVFCEGVAGYSIPGSTIARASSRESQ